MNEFEKLKELEGKATKGPWFAKADTVSRDFYGFNIGPRTWEECDETGGYWVYPGDVADEVCENDAEYIAHSRNMLPKIFHALACYKHLLNHLLEFDGDPQAIDSQVIDAAYEAQKALEGEGGGDV